MSEGQARPTIWLSEMQRRVETAAARLATQVLAINEQGEGAEASLAAHGQLGGGSIVLSSDKYEQWNQLRERLETVIAKTMLKRYDVQADDVVSRASVGEVIVEMPDISLLNPHGPSVVKWQSAQSKLVLGEG